MRLNWDGLKEHLSKNKLEDTARAMIMVSVALLVLFMILKIIIGMVW